MGKTKKVRQVQIDDSIFKNKFPIVFNQDPVVEYLKTSIYPDQPFRTLLKDKLMEELKDKPEHPMKEVIEDLVLNRGLKKDIEGWGAIYYPPVLRNEEGKFITQKTILENAPYGVGLRVFINLGKTKEILNIDFTSFGATKKIVLYPDEAFSLDLGIAQAVEVSVYNNSFEKIEAIKGRRPLGIKKNPENRCLLIMDGYISIETLAENASKYIKEKTGYEFDFNDIKNNFPGALKEN